MNPCELPAFPFIAVLFAMIGSKWQQQARLIVVFLRRLDGFVPTDWSHSPVGEEKR